ncbi:unnamed protein product [Cladocopium goreaui]|uniref:Uncharacterized protein n=1 Tax=Cladocopium goreaui TaxID=2562237 RepID=A0A9P1C3D4_9DINO|nr:unnamed protein product [Cladocopium goreaui]
MQARLARLSPRPAPGPTLAVPGAFVAGNLVKSLAETGGLEMGLLAHPKRLKAKGKKMGIMLKNRYHHLGMKRYCDPKYKNKVTASKEVLQLYATEKGRNLTMADKSFAWAKARGLVRDNTVHGEEEAKLVLEDSFANNNEKGEMTGLRADGLVEDPAFSIFTAR